MILLLMMMKMMKWRVHGGGLWMRSRMQNANAYEWEKLIRNKNAHNVLIFNKYRIILINMKYGWYTRETRSFDLLFAIAQAPVACGVLWCVGEGSPNRAGELHEIREKLSGCNAIIIAYEIGMLVVCQTLSYCVSWCWNSNGSLESP